jgi:hypothetical protein
MQLIKDLLSRNKVLSILVGAALICSLAIKNLLKETKEALKRYLRAKLTYFIGSRINGHADHFC